METDEQREEVIQHVADMLRRNPFSVEFKVLKHPKGIKIIYEVTKEEMDAMVKRAAEQEKEKS